MVILDVTVINVAVPVVGRELSASLTGIQWITDGYTLVFAGLLLTGGALGTGWATAGSSAPAWWSSRSPRPPAAWHRPAGP